MRVRVSLLQTELERSKAQCHLLRSGNHVLPVWYTSLIWCRVRSLGVHRGTCYYRDYVTGVECGDNLHLMEIITLLPFLGSALEPSNMFTNW